MSIKVALFVTVLLAFVYAVLSITNETKTDTLAGMIVCAAGLIGYAVVEWWEDYR